MESHTIAKLVEAQASCLDAWDYDDPNECSMDCPDPYPSALVDSLVVRVSLENLGNQYENYTYHMNKKPPLRKLVAMLMRVTTVAILSSVQQIAAKTKLPSPPGPNYYINPTNVPFNDVSPDCKTSDTCCDYMFETWTDYVRE
ncbi:hypothetical protein MRB53_041743 [Persea americana]|nr:hypothetical protein MRB53_041743 [Persea americana]